MCIQCISLFGLCTVQWKDRKYQFHQQSAMLQFIRSSPQRWPNKPIHTSTIKLNAATNQIVVFVKVDETFTMIWLSTSSEVKVKVMWALKFQKWRFSKSISCASFQPIKKIPTVSNTRTKYLKSLGQIFEFPPSYRPQILPKNWLRPILMKLGMMLEVDETFTTIWLSRSSEVRVKVRRWPQSPSGLFLCATAYML